MRIRSDRRGKISRKKLRLEPPKIGSHSWEENAGITRRAHVGPWVSCIRTHGNGNSQDAGGKEKDAHIPAVVNINWPDRAGGAGAVAAGGGRRDYTGESRRNRQIRESICEQKKLRQKAQLGDSRTVGAVRRARPRRAVGIGTQTDSNTKVSLRAKMTSFALPAPSYLKSDPSKENKKRKCAMQAITHKSKEGRGRPCVLLVGADKCRSATCWRKAEVE